MAQSFPSRSGQAYRLSFDAFSGTWDGNDTDVVVVSIGDLTRVIGVPAKHAVNAGAPSRALKVSLVFKATGPRTHLSFYADRGSCIDIDNVSVVPLEARAPLKNPV